jgi:hypothetical protein
VIGNRFGPTTTTTVKSQHHGLAKAGITTTKTPLSSGFETKSSIFSNFQRQKP